MFKNNLIQSRQELIEAIQQGFAPKYLFFWGHQPENVVGKNCFSQWYSAAFEVDNILYATAEHYMMAEKARLFENDAIVNKIIQAKHPGEAKQLGREIQNFNETLWQEKRMQIVVKGNLAKFSQNQALKTFLINTQHRILVEASPVDKTWGIGLAADHELVTQPEKWPGLNLLGFALMKVRHLLNT
jgi:ribA/ribD-fused uncharacterized protein